VNSIASETRDLKEAGAISKAFLLAGGMELQQVFVNLLIVLVAVDSVLENSHNTL